MPKEQPAQGQRVVDIDGGRNKSQLHYVPGQNQDTGYMTSLSDKTKI